MNYVTCKGCGSQFDTSKLAVGTTFKCGKCGGLVTVEPPTMQPIDNSSTSTAPATVVLTPEQMRAALAQSRGEQPPAQPVPVAKPQSSKPKLPKAMQKRAQQKEQRSSGRPGAAASKTSGKSSKAKSKSSRSSKSSGRSGTSSRSSSGGESKSRSSRSSRGSSRGSSRREESEKKPPVALFAGIGVGVVALAAAGFFLMGDKDGDTSAEGGNLGDTATATESGSTGDSATGISSGGSDASGGSGTESAGPADEWDAFKALSRDDQEMKTLQDIEAAKGDKAALIKLGEWLQHDKLATNAVAKKRLEQIIDQVIQIDTKDPWAREARGEKNPVEMLTKCIDDNPVAFNYADSAENRIKERLDELQEGSPWVDAKEFAELEELCAGVAERNKALAESPRLQDIEKEKDWVRKNPLFEGMEVISRVADPYVLFQAVKLFDEEGKEHMNEQRREKAELYATRQATLFQELHDQYREYFAERFNLPVQHEVGKPMRAFVLWDRQAFVDWHKDQENSGIVAFARAYYTPSERRIVNYMGTDALTSQDELKCAEGQVQKGFDQVTIHEGLHQLMHEYQAITMGAPLSDTNNEVPPRKSMWFDEGWAELMGGMEYQDDEEVIRTLQGVKFRHNRIHLDRTSQMRRHRKANGTFWTIADLLKPNHNGELMQKSAELYPTNPNFMANIFYGQSWSLAHFFMNYDGGKYRDPFMEYAGHYLKNTHSPEKLAEVFGRKGPEDWGEIQKEWEWYYTECMNRLIGRKIDPRTRAVIGWHLPETEGPKGPMVEEDDDTDFLDDDDEE